MRSFLGGEVWYQRRNIIWCKTCSSIKLRIAWSLIVVLLAFGSSDHFFKLWTLEFGIIHCLFVSKFKMETNWNDSWKNQNWTLNQMGRESFNRSNSSKIQIDTTTSLSPPHLPLALAIVSYLTALLNRLKWANLGIGSSQLIHIAIFSMTNLHAFLNWNPFDPI